MLNSGEPLLKRRNRCVRKLAITALAGLVALFFFLPSMVQAWYPPGTPGSIVGWGGNNYGQATPPTGNDYTAVSAGLDHGLALKSDGSIVGWGWNDDGQATPPAGNDYVAVSAGYAHGLAIRATPTPTPTPLVNRQAAHDSIGVTEPAKTWYLAEGSTEGGFETWILVANPGDETAHVQLTYMTDQGEVAGPSFDLPAKRRRSDNVASVVQTYNVSTKVTSNKPVVAERAMYYGQ